MNRLGADSARRRVKLANSLRQEVSAKLGDILAMIAQCRNREGNYCEPVVQILAKTAFLYATLQIPVSRDQQPYIGVAGLGRSEPRDQAVGQHPQQFGLCRQRHFGGLVEKESAFVCSLENSLARAVGAGESTSLVSEQLAFQKSFGKRRAIDGDQGLLSAQTVAMNCAGD